MSVYLVLLRLLLAPNSAALSQLQKISLIFPPFITPAIENFESTGCTTG